MAEQQPSKGSHGGGMFSKYINSAMNTINEKMPAVGAIQHTLRQQAVLHSPSQNADTLKLQLAIKASKGVVIDTDALARESKVFSKQLYLFGTQEKGADVVDITDRLAYLVFQGAEVTEQHAKRLEQSRQGLKDIRNFENDLVPKRQRRQALSNKVAQLQQNPKADKNGELAKLRGELEQLEREDSTFEASLDVLKRQKLHEAFSLYWAAQKEFGEKMAVLAGFGDLLLQGMETDGVEDQYSGREKTAEIRVEAAAALEKWNAGTPLIARPKLASATGGSGSSFLDRSDSKSFGQTHATQLSQVQTANPFADPHTGSPTLPFASGSATAGQHLSTPHDRILPPVPAGAVGEKSSPEGRPAINLSPTLSPSGGEYTALPPPSTGLRNPHETVPPAAVLAAQGAAETIPSGPTVAETGQPIVGKGGPISGQLKPRSPSTGEHPIPLASFGSNDGSDVQHLKAKAEEAEAERRASTSSGSDLNRMPSTSRHRLERAEQDLSGDNPPPAYGDEESPEQRASREAEAILAREREGKRMM